MGPRRCLQRGCWLPQELQASSRPPASQGRNAKDQLSTELRLPFRGAPGAGPSPAAKLTGSVCPTGRAALAKNSALPIANCARPEPGPRFWKSKPRQSKELGELRSLTPGLAQVPSPRPCPQAQRCLHSCREGWQVRGPRRRRGRPGWEPAARPPARSSGPPCPFWGLLPARSARTRFAAEVRPGRLRACPLLFPGTCWGLFLLPHPKSAARGRGGGDPRQPHRVVDKSQVLYAHLPLV